METVGLFHALMDHLSDLQRVLTRSAIAIAVTTCVTFYFVAHFFHLLLRPYLQFAPGQTMVLQSLDPAETLSISFQISLIMGIIAASPIIMREGWWFIAPGLKPQERRYISVAFFLGLILFAVGAFFAYWVVLPMTLRFFWDFSLSLGVTPAWSIDNYISFVMTELLAFGLAFELPIVTTLLSYLNIVTPQTLAKGRRYAIFIIFVIAALLTPPDVVSQCLMALPMMALYEVSIWLSKWISSHAT